MNEVQVDNELSITVKKRGQSVEKDVITNEQQHDTDSGA